MKEESRIEALEHELKILKNEIQSTLLEIREQILNHYYPELRAEEPLHHHSLPVRSPVARPGLPPKGGAASQEEAVSLSEITAKGQIQPFSDIFLGDLADEELDDELEPPRETLGQRRPPGWDDFEDAEELEVIDEDDADDGIVVRELKVQEIASGTRQANATTPTTREVNFRQLKQSDNHTNIKAVPAARADEVPATSLPNLAALTQWANDGVATVGKERVLEVIDTYSTGGKLSGAARSALQKIIGRAQDIEHDTPASSREMLALMVGLDQILGQ